MTIDEAIKYLKAIGKGFAAEIKIPGLTLRFDLADLDKIEASAIWLSKLIAQTLIRHRIFWIDISHEFRFVGPAERFKVCKASLQDTADLIRAAYDNPPNLNSEGLKFIGILLVLETKLRLASADVVDMELWNNEAMFGADERIGDSEHLQMVLDTIVKVRKDTFGAWELLVGLLPEGELKKEAEIKLRDVRIFDRIVGNENSAQVEIVKTE